MSNTWKILKSDIWKSNDLVIGRAVSQYETLDQLHIASNKEDTVRLHMGLRGDYSFKCKQIAGEWDLLGGHHNLLYSDGLDLEIRNKSNEIETFGIHFPKSLFLELTSDQGVLIKDFRSNIKQGQGATISPQWGGISNSIQKTVNDIIQNPYQGSIEELYVFGKAFELLALCIDQYKNNSHQASHLKSKSDREAIIAARDYINSNIHSPPGISQIAREVGINEFKLKYGFKEMFENSVFGYILERRLEIATRLLTDSNKSVGEISEELGYSSPQHFSSQYKEKRGLSPSSVRNGIKIGSIRN